MKGRAPRPAISNLALAGVKARLDAQSQTEQLVADVECAADCTGSSVEDGGDATLAGFDLAARIACERLSDH